MRRTVERVLMFILDRLSDFLRLITPHNRRRKAYAVLELNKPFIGSSRKRSD